MDQIKKGGVVYVQGETPEQQQPGGPSDEGNLLVYSVIYSVSSVISRDLHGLICLLL
jgi:hypothetical protein